MTFKYIVEVENAGVVEKIETYTVNFFKLRELRDSPHIAPSGMDAESLNSVLERAEGMLNEIYEKTVTTKRYTDFNTLRQSLRVISDISKIPFPARRFANNDIDKRMAWRSQMLTKWFNDVISRIGGIPPQLEQFFGSGLGGKVRAEEVRAEEANPMMSPASW